MSDKNLVPMGSKSFEDLKKVNEHGAEYWSAREAGVHDKMFGVFHDSGYKGMYGGLGRDAIKKHKGIPVKENLIDRMDTTELAANQFRMTHRLGTQRPTSRKFL